MKQVIVRAGRVVVVDVPEPTLEPGCVLVDVHASCISTGTELSGIASANSPLWKRAARNPAKVKRALEMVGSQGVRHTVSVVRDQVSTATAVGYSAAGIVRAVAMDVDGFQAGDRVACAGAGVASHAAVARVPVNLAVHVPHNVPLSHASTVALGAIALQGVRRAGLCLGESVVVVGLGAIGQLTVQMLKSAGCRVLVADPDSGRVGLALAHGADVALSAQGADPENEVALLTSGVGADAVVITAASPSDDIVSRAFHACRKKGRVVLVGDVGLNLSRNDFYAKELDFLVSTSYGPGRYDRRYEEDGLDYPIGYVRWTENRNMEEYLRMVSDGRVRAQPLVDEVYPVGDAPVAYAALAAPVGRPLSAVLDYGTAKQDVAAPPARLRAPRPVGAVTRRGKVSLGLVGAGSFARTMHLPNLRALGDLFELRWVVSRSGAGASDLARQHGAPFSSTDIEEALADEHLDAFLIATRHGTHASLALRCLEAGKHVLVEKPLAMSRAELSAIERFFDGQGGDGSRPVLMTGFNRRFSEHALRIAKRFQDRLGPMLISYRVNAGWVRPDNWVYGEQGGGRNVGEACHMYDLCGFLTSSRYSWAQAGVIGPVPHAYHRNDNFTTTIGFADGSLATVTYTSLGASQLPKERCEIFCDGAVGVLDDFKSTVVIDARGTTEISVKADKGHRAELEAFARCILDGGDWPVPLWQQVQATEIAFEVEEGLRNRPRARSDGST